MGESTEGKKGTQRVADHLLGARPTAATRMTAVRLVAAAMLLGLGPVAGPASRRGLRPPGDSGQDGRADGGPDRARRRPQA